MLGWVGVSATGWRWVGVSAAGVRWVGVSAASLRRGQRRGVLFGSVVLG